MPGNPVYWFSIPVFREEGAPLTDSHRRAAPRSGGRRLQKPAPRTRKRRHGIFFKLYTLLVVLSAGVVGLYIAHALWVTPPEIPQTQTPQTPDTGAAALANPEDPGRPGPPGRGV